MGAKRKEIETKINEKMDIVQRMMESQVHISDAEKVKSAIYNATVYWTVMSEEDKDYIHCALDAIEDGVVWNVE